LVVARERKRKYQTLQKESEYSSAMWRIGNKDRVEFLFHCRPEPERGGEDWGGSGKAQYFEMEKFVETDLGGVGRRAQRSPYQRRGVKGKEGTARVALQRAGQF